VRDIDGDATPETARRPRIAQDRCEVVAVSSQTGTLSAMFDVPALSQQHPRLVGAPVALKLGTTFEVRVRFAGALPPSPDGTGAHAEFSIGPSTSDHAPVEMKRSAGHCYRQTLYNDLGRASLRRLRAGDRVTLIIDVVGRPPKIVRRITLATDVNAVPPGCRLSPKPGPG
jgi:hypothetical protein